LPLESVSGYVTRPKHPASKGSLSYIQAGYAYEKYENAQALAKLQKSIVDLCTARLYGLQQQQAAETLSNLTVSLSPSQKIRGCS